MLAGDSLEARYDMHFSSVNSRSPKQTLVKCSGSTVEELTSWKIMKKDPRVNVDIRFLLRVKKIYFSEQKSI